MGAVPIFGIEGVTDFREGIPSPLKPLPYTDQLHLGPNPKAPVPLRHASGLDEASGVLPKRRFGDSPGLVGRERRRVYHLLRTAPQRLLECIGPAAASR
jgi:hypothetical protein